MSCLGFLVGGVGQGLAAILVGSVGVGIGLVGNEMRARNYFQVVAIAAGLGLVMALGASLAGAQVLFGIPLTIGSLLLFAIVVAAVFFAGFEPEAVDEPRLVWQ